LLALYIIGITGVYMHSSTALMIPRLSANGS